MLNHLFQKECNTFDYTGINNTRILSKSKNFLNFLYIISFYLYFKFSFVCTFIIYINANFLNKYKQYNLETCASKCFTNKGCNLENVGTIASDFNI